MIRKKKTNLRKNERYNISINSTTASSSSSSSSSRSSANNPVKTNPTLKPTAKVKRTVVQAKKTAIQTKKKTNPVISVLKSKLSIDKELMKKNAHIKSQKAQQEHIRPMKMQRNSNSSKNSDKLVAPIEAETHDSINDSQMNNKKDIGKSSNELIDQFIHEILKWDLGEALLKEVSGEADSSIFEVSDDENMAENDVSKEEGEVKQLRIPNKFSSYGRYFSIWRPLALREVQAQIINKVTTEGLPRSISVTLEVHKSFNSNIVELRVALGPHEKQLQVQRRYNFNKQKDILEEFFTKDLVLISTDKDYIARRLQSSLNNSKLTNKNKQDGFLGIVTSQLRSRSGLVVEVQCDHWNILESLASPPTSPPSSTPENSAPLFHLFKLNSLVTSLREFKALCECREFPLMPLLLSGKSEMGSMQLDSLGEGFVHMLRSRFNESQLEAIAAAATSPGFTLIKGPPGTGKTTTLKGLLNSLHLREYGRYYNAVLDVAKRPDNETYNAWRAIGNEKPHILMTAPSNTAVDNVVNKIMEEGFCDGEGRKYFPNIVRVGRGQSGKVEAVSLEQLVSNFLKDPPETVERKLDSLKAELHHHNQQSQHLRSELRRIVSHLDMENLHENWRRKEQHDQRKQQQIDEQHFQQNSPPVPSFPSPPPPPPPPPQTPSPPTTPLAVENEVMLPSIQNNLSMKEAPSSILINSGSYSHTDLEEDEDEVDEPLCVITHPPPPPPPLPHTPTSDQEDQCQSKQSRNSMASQASCSPPSPPPPPPPPPLSPPSSTSAYSPPPPPPTTPTLEPNEEEELDVPPIPPPSSPTQYEVEETTFDFLPSSPTIIPKPQLSIPTTFPTDDEDLVMTSVEYDKSEDYRQVAQQINQCLETAANLTLKIQRYELVRRSMREDGTIPFQTRESLQASFLQSAHIVFTTLSSAGLSALDMSNHYDVLVVDEAAQAVELSNLIPMRFRIQQCVLVGDPQQLSATVFSKGGAQSLYERSLFERLEACGHPFHMLRTQYRSHPVISYFPRNYFYNGLLEDGANVLDMKNYHKPYHSVAPAFKPLVFWNLLGSRESKSSSNQYAVSRQNVGEARLAINLYLTLRNSCGHDAIAGLTGVITPYSQQQSELNRQFKAALGPSYKDEVEINTVDGFQGREKDIIILSTVRADPGKGVGFLNDIRRMNVALTRAKYACYVIGNEATLYSSKPWMALLEHTLKTGCMVHVEDPNCNLLQAFPSNISSIPTHSASSHPPLPPLPPGPQPELPPPTHPHFPPPPPPQHVPTHHFRGNIGILGGVLPSPPPPILMGGCKRARSSSPIQHNSHHRRNINQHSKMRKHSNNRTNNRKNRGGRNPRKRENLRANCSNSKGFVSSGSSDSYSNRPSSS